MLPDVTRSESIPLESLAPSSRPDPTPAESLTPYLDVATEAAIAAGNLLRTYLGNLSQIDEKGRSGDLVTEADRAAETLILQHLRQHFPDHAILAEESGVIAPVSAPAHPASAHVSSTHSSSSQPAATPYRWAIDPLDGTTNFTHQYPFYAVSISLLINDLPQVGVIYAPSLNELFQAAPGHGATCNGQPIHVSSTDTLDRSLLVTGFAYDRRDTLDTNYAEFCALTHQTQGVRRGGSAALDLAYVACGRLDGYWERGLSPWDLAAGVVLVREAGGQVSAYDTSPFQLTSGRILATNGKLHIPLSQALGRVRPLPLDFYTTFGAPEFPESPVRGAIATNTPSTWVS